MAAMTSPTTEAAAQAHADMIKEPPARLAPAVAVLKKLLTNILEHPDDAKFRRLKLSNQALCRKLWPCSGAQALLVAVGFHRTTAEGDQVLVLSEDRIGGLADELRWLERLEREIRPQGLTTRHSDTAEAEPHRQTRSEEPSVGLSHAEKRRRAEQQRREARERQAVRERVKAEWRSEHGCRQARHAPRDGSPSSPSPHAAPRSDTGGSTRTDHAAAPGTCHLRVRMPDGSRWEIHLPPDTPLEAVYTAMIQQQVVRVGHRDPSQGSFPVPGQTRTRNSTPTDDFSLMISHPRRELYRELYGAKTLEELGLAPASSLVAFPSACRGVVRNAVFEDALHAVDGDGMDDDALNALSYQDLLDLEARMGSAKAPAAAVPIDQLTELRTYSDADSTAGGCEASCSICLEAFVASDCLRVLRCQHKFHASCLEKWFSVAPHLSCPMCKAAVSAS